MQKAENSKITKYSVVLLKYLKHWTWPTFVYLTYIISDQVDQTKKNTFM